MRARVALLPFFCAWSLAGNLPGAETPAGGTAASSAQDLPPEASEENQKKSKELLQEGLTIEKEKDIPAAIAKWEAALKLDGRNAACLNHYAWFLAVTAPEERRDAKKALELAIRAAQASAWRNRDILDTVAEVYFQLKQYEKAVETQKKALVDGLEGHSKPKYLEAQLQKFEKALEEAKKK